MMDHNDSFAKPQPNPVPGFNQTPLKITEDMLDGPAPETRIDFERGMSYFPRLTILLIITNVVIFIWQLVSGALNSKEAIIAGGALERERLLSGEIWRLVTPMVLHGSIDHLIGNCLALYVLGMACEHVLSLPQVGVIYLVSGICGSLLSVLAQPGPSVGASGAIFGLMAATVVFLYRYQKAFYVRDHRIGFVIAAWGLYTIATGFLTPYVDNFAHIGGAIGGAVAMWVQTPARLITLQAIANPPQT